MKPLWQGVLVIALLLLWGQAQYCAGRRGAQLQASRDSLAADRQAFAAQTATADSARQALGDSIARLTALGGRQAAQLVTTRQQAGAAARARDSLAARVDVAALPDTIRQLLEAERTVGTAAMAHAQACDASLQTCAQRGQLLERQVALGDSLLGVTRSRLLDAQEALEKALGKARPKRCGIGGTAGYGATSAAGVVQAGPSVTIGVTCQLVRLF